MSEYKQKILLTNMSRILISVLGAIAIWCDGLQSDICGTVSLILWVHLPLIVKIEHKVAHIILLKIRGLL
jgi:hypothetical protein